MPRKLLACPPEVKPYWFSPPAWFLPGWVMTIDDARKNLDQLIDKVIVAQT
jgi:hypothetical protein